MSNAPGPYPTGVLIKSDIQNLKLIEFPDGEREEDRLCFKAASYDLRLGSQYVLPGVMEDGTVNLKILDCAESGDLFIEPFTSVVVSTYEVVKLPANVVGKFNLRIKQALRGLIVQMGTQVEPGYEGRLFALLQNLTAERIKIKYKHLEYRLFTIEFTYTTAPADVTPNKILGMEAFLPAIGVRSTFGAFDAIMRRLQAHVEDTKRSEDDIYEKIKNSKRDLETKIDKEITAAGPRFLAIYGVILTLAVAGVITILAPIIMKQVSDIPLSDIRATTVSEQAKSVSESVREENVRLKESVKEVREKSTDNEESLRQALKRISDLEKRIARTASSGALSDRMSGTKAKNGEGRDR